MAIQKLAVEPILSGLSSAFTVTANAKGAVYSGSGIGAYENQILDKPTLFAFENGVGLAGEAGEEAIMPLTRTASGDLGVRAETGGSSIVQQINIYEAKGTTATVEQSDDGRTLNVIIEQVESNIQGRMTRGAGLATFLDSRYGRRV